MNFIITTLPENKVVITSNNYYYNYNFNYKKQETTEANKNQDLLKENPTNPHLSPTSSSTSSTSSPQINRQTRRQRKKIGKSCYCLNSLETFGNISVIQNKKNSNICYISKLRLIKFNDNFDILFEKGIKEKSKENWQRAPDKTFWNQRYYYYSKFDLGIKMDFESWWEVTPEIISEYTAKLIKGKTVIDGFCGSGGNVIQFSKYCSKVYAIDIDLKKLEICKSNCKVYNCKDNIKFIHCDFLKCDQYKDEKIEADYIFLSPPWGGVQYKQFEIYSIIDSMRPSIFDIVKMSLTVAKKILFYLPRSLLLEELFEIITSVTDKENLFFDVHILRSANKIKALLIIFGEDINNDDDWDNKIINENDIKYYLESSYNIENIKEEYIKKLAEVSEICGKFKFFKNELEFRKNLKEGKMALEKDDDIINVLINYFVNDIFNEEERNKFLEVYGVRNKEKINLISGNAKELSNNSSNSSSSVNSSRNNNIYTNLEVVKPISLDFP